MDYKITCVCGHPFIVSEEVLRTMSGGTINCPACQQRLSPAIEVPIPRPQSAASAGAASDSAGQAAAASDDAAPTPAVPSLEPTKRCPFCGEIILAIARKCKHCGEFLDRAAPALHAPPVGAAGPLTPGTAPAPGGTSNDPVYSLTISQWDNFWRFLTIFTVFVALAALLWYLSTQSPKFQTVAALGIPAAFLLAGLAAGYYYLRAKRTHMIIRPLRIDVEKGILSKNITSLELFRIQDIALQQGLIPRILGFGTVKLTTNDADSPELVLYQIPHAREVRHYLQTQVPLAARQRGAVYMES
jgi:membrane protein YdbS with pleckstrin-like domain